MNSSGGPGFQKKNILKGLNANWTRFGFNCHTLLVLTYVTDELRGFFNSLRKWSLKGARSAGIKILLEFLELTISPENHSTSIITWIQVLNWGNDNFGEVDFGYGYPKFIIGIPEQLFFSINFFADTKNWRFLEIYLLLWWHFLDSKDINRAQSFFLWQLP